MEALARDVMALMRNVPPDSIELTVEPHLDDEAAQAVAESEAAPRRARQAAEEASRLQRGPPATLRSRYRLTVRDAGMLLHASHASPAARQSTRTQVESENTDRRPAPVSTATEYPPAHARGAAVLRPGLPIPAVRGRSPGGPKGPVQVWGWLRRVGL